MTSALIRHPTFKRERTRSLRTGLTIGNPQDVVNAATVLAATQICNIYGSSEACGNCCVTRSSWPLERRSSCQGPPLPGVSIRLIDVQTGAPTKSGFSGLIEVRGYLMGGYLGHGAAHNAEVFTAEGWYRSGDVGLADLGQSAAMLCEGQFYLGKAGPVVNPSGGTLCTNAIAVTAMVRIAEVALQVWGRAGAHQVQGAKIGIASGNGGDHQFFGTMVVEAQSKTD